MDPREYPILEHDPDRKVLIDPSQLVPKLDVPEHCLIPFYLKVIKRLEKKGVLRKITQETSQVTPPLPLYETTHEGKRLAVMTPGLTAPFAAGILEFAIATGCKKFIAFGSCGVLDKTIEKGKLIIPTAAIRDEGTSYHYIPPSREITADPTVVDVIKKGLIARKIEFIEGKTWTTDGIYRETPEKIKRRKKEGAITVEMEAAALFAVAKFRNTPLGFLLAGGDDVSGIEWDTRNFAKESVKVLEKFFWLAAEICLKL